MQPAPLMGPEQRPVLAGLKRASPYIMQIRPVATDNFPIAWTAPLPMVI